MCLQIISKTYLFHAAFGDPQKALALHMCWCSIASPMSVRYHCYSQLKLELKSTYNEMRESTSRMNVTMIHLIRNISFWFARVTFCRLKRISELIRLHFVRTTREWNVEHLCTSDSDCGLFTQW